MKYNTILIILIILLVLLLFILLKIYNKQIENIDDIENISSPSPMETVTVPDSRLYKLLKKTKKVIPTIKKRETEIAPLKGSADFNINSHVEYGNDNAYLDGYTKIYREKQEKYENKPYDFTVSENDDNLPYEHVEIL